MSLFCTLCQFTRGLLRRNACAADQLFQNIKISRTFTVSTKDSHVFTSNYIKLCRRRATDFRERPSVTFFSENMLKAQTFCTKTKYDENKEDGSVVKREANQKDDQESERLIGSVDEENLTDEERQILRELEEEERRYREVVEEDYNMWDGSFDEIVDNRLSKSMSEGHVRFENRQRVIQDVIEEMWDPLPPRVEEDEELQYFPRGKTGIFDLGELVDLLREENAYEIVAISIPKEFDYADHMVVVTVGNNKHLVALATFVRKRCKQKDLKSTDKLPLMNKSVDHRGWIALDIGNIILHIFLQDVRDYYDLETLWTVGSLFDDLTNAQDPEIVQLLNSIS